MAGAEGTVQIDPDGAMWAYSPTANDAQPYTSLAGISFPLGSLTLSISPGKAGAPAAPSLAHLLAPKIGRYQPTRHELAERYDSRC
jgi:hypothetical protein